MTSVSSGDLQRAGKLIRAGRLVAFPTETVYGLGANALDASAVERIFRAKGRPSNSPLIVHVDSVEMARGLVAAWPPEADSLAGRYWPGPLTLVLPKLPLVPDIVTAGLATVGIRMPDHPTALALIRESGVPIAAPSANRFAQISPTTADHVRDSLGSAVEMILDSGPTVLGIESTVLSLAASPPRLLRPGMISRQEIEELIGPVELAGRLENGEAGPHPSPGMHRRHYSPATPLILVDGGTHLPAGRGAYLWREHRAEAAKCVEMPGDPARYAAVLYDTLHREDKQGWDWIAVEEVPGTPEWTAVSDRLRHAASQTR